MDFFTHLLIKTWGIFEDIKVVVKCITNIMDKTAEVIRSFSTIREMFSDRAKSDPEKWGGPLLQAVDDGDLAEQALKQSFVVPLDNSVKIVYSLHNKFKVPDVKKLITSGKISPEDTVIIVAVDKPTNTNMRTLKGMLQRVQVFELQKLLFNVTNHDLVPLHEVVGNDEIASILDRFNVKTKLQLPFILSSDPVAQYLALKPGQVVKVTRSSPSAGVCEVYRTCV